MIEDLDQRNADLMMQRWSVWPILTVVGLAIVLAVPSFILLNEQISLNRTDATIDGLALHLERVDWIEDQMDHGTSIPMPPSMTPDLPEDGSHRLALELSIYNEGQDSKTFNARELILETSDGRATWPSQSRLEHVKLRGGQSTYFPIQFDVNVTDNEEDFRIVWIRNNTEIGMLAVPHPPEHEDDEKYQPTNWPADIDGLPAGDADAGKAFYSVKYGCKACHGDPEVPDSNTLAPHLGQFGVAFVDGTSVRSVTEYIYESILEPNQIISENCRAGPCSSPSSMPPYKRVMTPQIMADIIAYLVELDGSR